jgi:asparagine synthase (glutamine-hydrolysing)
MCGITGIWNLNGKRIIPEILEKFTDAIHDRGPDGFGYAYFYNGTLGFGHRRLSILDLTEAAKQPMHCADGRFTITYNGEIYNFQDIKDELELEHYHFKTESDTEVILAAYHKWGKECLHKFNGMWAFAIWDRDKEELFLARDRFGIKPFNFIHEKGKIFAFSSETISFKYLENYRRQFDFEMLKLNTSGVRIQGSGHTIYNGIFQLLPGHYAYFRQHDTHINQKRWWNITHHCNKKTAKKSDEIAAEYYDLLRDACRLRLISDVPVGTALSGGLDSSSIYSTVYDIISKEHLTRFAADSQRAFVVTFPGLIEDEREYANEALKFTGGPAVFIEQIFKDLPNQIELDTKRFDSLGVAPITSISSIYRGMKENGIKVSLDGHGVDEMLYGYRDMIHNLFYYFYEVKLRRLLQCAIFLQKPTMNLKWIT